MGKNKRDRASSRTPDPAPLASAAKLAAPPTAMAKPNSASPAENFVPSFLPVLGRAAEFLSEPLPFFRKPDWLAFAAATLATLLVYIFTLAPNLTPEDSGELATASMYAGVPHAPGYPLWTIYSWLFTVLVPTGSIAWRVGLSSAVAAALSCGLAALIIARGSRLMFSGSTFFSEMTESTRNAISVVAGFVGGAIFGFTGPMWSQAVIVEVYTLSTLTFVAVLVLLMRWFFAPEKNWPLYAAGLLFGLCLANHQSLLLAAVGIEVLIFIRRREIGRDFFLFNTLVYLSALLWMALKEGSDTQTSGKLVMFGIFNLIGVGGMLLAAWHLIPPAQPAQRPASGFFMIAAFGLCCVLIAFFWSAFVWPLAQPMATDHAVWNLKAVWSAYYKFTDRMLLTFCLLLLSGAIGLLLYLAVATDAASRRSKWCAGLLAAFTVLSLLWMHQLLSSRGTIIENTASVVNAWQQSAAQHLLIANKISAAFVLLSVCFLGGVCLTAWRRAHADIFPLQHWRALCGVLLAGLLGVSFYLFMPLSSLTNPPMNWAYPRMAQGLKHAVTRGQYTNPAQETSDSFARVFVDWDANRVLDGGQVGIYVDETIQEFYPAYLLLGLLPFLMWRHLGHRERRWIFGVSMLFVSMTILLIIFRNIEGSEQQRHLNKVFFESSHLFVALGVGWGVALALGAAVCRWVQWRTPLLVGAGVLLALELFWLPWNQTAISSAPMSVLHAFSGYDAPLLRAAPLLGAVLMVAVLLALLLRRERAPLVLLLLVASLMPARHAMANWWDNELRGHYFGYWYGRDMFSPPIANTNAAPLYPPMARDAVLFGGTDAGRFCPTYMIFCESLAAPQFRTDKDFDRRDVYIITQNALADATYLQYIRAHYNRSRQFDDPFLHTLVVDEDAGGEITERFTQQQAAVDAEFKGRAGQINADMNALLASLGQALDQISIPADVGANTLLTRLEWVARNMPPGNPHRQRAHTLHMEAIQLSGQLSNVTNDWNERLLDHRLAYDRDYADQKLFGSARLMARATAPVDGWLNSFGDAVERDRRAGSSLVQPEDITDLTKLSGLLRESKNPVAAWIWKALAETTRQRLTANDTSSGLRSALSTDLNAILLKEYRQHQEHAQTLSRLHQADLQLLHQHRSGFDGSSLTPINSHVADRELAIKHLLRYCYLPTDGSNHIARLQHNVRTNDASLLDLYARNAGLSREPLAQSAKERAAIIASLCQSELYDAARFSGIALDADTRLLLAQNPFSHSRICMNRRLLEAALPDCLRSALAGVYPAREIYIPTISDLQATHERARSTATSTDEAVWAINGDLTEIIFKQNPTHEFYLEESLALDWMYPHLVPYGIIMKIERQAQREWSPEKLADILARDRAFWLSYAEQLSGNIVQPDTSLETICQWAERVFQRRDHRGHTAEQKRFLRDYVAQRAFAKLRVSIAQLYAWRARQCLEQIRQIDLLPPSEQPKEISRRQRLQQQHERLVEEADFAYRQSFSFCPSSPEAPYRYLSFLLDQKGGAQSERMEKCRLLIDTSLKMDPSDLRSRDGMVGLVRHHARSHFALADTDAAMQVIKLGLSLERRFINADPILSACVTLHQLLAENRAPEAGQYMKEIQPLLQPGGIGQMAVAGVLTAYQKKALTGNIAQLEQAWQKDPTNHMAAYSLINAYRSLNRTSDIRRFAERAVAPQQVSPQLLVLGAHAFQSVGDWAQEEAVRQRIIKLTPERADAWYDLAIAQNKLRKTNDAVAALRQAWEHAGSPSSRVNIRQWIRTTNALDNLRGLPEFKALLGTNAP